MKVELNPAQHASILNEMKKQTRHLRAIRGNSTVIALIIVIMFLGAIVISLGFGIATGGMS